MKRVNIRDAFAGDPNPGQEGLAQERGHLAADDEGSEALLLAVRGGELTVVIPAGLPDEHAVDDAECIRGVLRLENERVFTFEIQSGATGAFYDDEPATLHRRRQSGGSGGLSTVSSGHDYMADPRTGGAATGTPGKPRVARDVMTTDPITARPDQSLQEAAELLLYHRISGLPVLDKKDQLVGVVSEADLIGKQGKSVAEVMSKHPITVSADDPLELVATTMSAHHIKRVPVLDGGKLAGIISRADVVRWVAGR
ncbi:MAG TPA: CBS domain-containing protein [Chloroflexota bacterium]|nr:CBS domain-containing protein [Chloroflexota bacterium]